MFRSPLYLAALGRSVFELGYHRDLSRDSVSDLSADARRLIVNANLFVDIRSALALIFRRRHSRLSRMHFDDCFGSASFSERWSEVERMIVDPETLTPKALARRLGEALHSGQDYYAHSNHVEQVTEQVMAGLDGTRPDLVTAFVSHHHGGALASLGPRLAEITGAGAVLGCTGESVIGADREVEQGPGLSVLAAHLPGTELRPFACQARPPEGDSERPGFIGLPVVGVVLMAALLIIPAAAARFWTDRLGVMLALAAMLGALTGAGGTFISSRFAWSSGGWPSSRPEAMRATGS